MNKLIERTADGSSTIYLPEMDEHYHSVKGALAESSHVYVDLCWRKAASRFPEVRLFEVGFGTGLNAALTADAAMQEQVPTVYYSVELNPLSPETLRELEYTRLTPLYSSVIEAEWGTPVVVNPYFTLVKIPGDFLAIPFPENLHAVYYDAFAPEKQPEMWSEAVISRLRQSISTGGILTTYCAKGVIRRRLLSLGFTVERLPGPPGGKREVLRATATSPTEISADPIF